MKTFYLITNTSNCKYWSYLLTASEHFIYKKMIAKYGPIYVNDKGGWFPQDCVVKVHKVVTQRNFPVDIDWLFWYCVAMITKTRQEIEDAVNKFVKGVQDKMNAYWQDMKFTYAPAPTITWEFAPKYIRVWKIEQGGKSIHTFIDATTGNVLKAASWKAPETKNPRSNIFDADCGLSGVTHHGAVYLR